MARCSPPRGARAGASLIAIACLAALLPPPPAVAPGAQAATRPRSGSPATVPPLPPPRPDRQPEAPPAEVAPSSPPLAQGEPAACLQRLATLGVVVEAVPAIADGACGAKHPFRVSALSQDLALTPAAVAQCPVIEALARWAEEAVAAEARTHLGRVPTKLLVGASYVCRGRNRVAGATLSEHAFANAVDIMGFEFATGGPIAVKAWPADSPEGRFLSAVRARACAHFTTVLGPGSDAAHADHLHFDLRVRKGGFRMCQ